MLSSSMIGCAAVRSGVTLSSIRYERCTRMVSRTKMRGTREGSGQ
jgi:hypothetical protein